MSDADFWRYVTIGLAIGAIAQELLLAAAFWIARSQCNLMNKQSDLIETLLDKDEEP